MHLDRILLLIKRPEGDDQELSNLVTLTGALLFIRVFTRGLDMVGHPLAITSPFQLPVWVRELIV